MNALKIERLQSIHHLVSVAILFADECDEALTATMLQESLALVDKRLALAKLCCEECAVD